MGGVVGYWGVKVYGRAQYLRAFFISKGVVSFSSQVLDVACWQNKALFWKASFKRPLADFLDSLWGRLQAAHSVAC